MFTWPAPTVSLISDDVIKWKTFSALLALCAGNSPFTGEFPAQRPVTRSFDVFFDLRLNKWLSKQWWGWWFETPLCPLWHHCNAVTCPVEVTTMEMIVNTVFWYKRHNDIHFIMWIVSNIISNVTWFIYRPRRRWRHRTNVHIAVIYDRQSNSKSCLQKNNHVINAPSPMVLIVHLHFVHYNHI